MDALRLRTGYRGLPVLALALLALAPACSRSSARTEGSPRVLVGAGATLPFPLYSKWASEFARVDPTVRMNYQSIGSGAGIRQISDGVVDFGATDEPMTDEQLRTRRRSSFTFRRPSAPSWSPSTCPARRELRLTPERHRRRLPRHHFALGRPASPRGERRDRDAERSPSPSCIAPTAAARAPRFTTYLSKHSEHGATTLARPRRRVSRRRRREGNDGVTAFVKSTPLSIGYVELAYARQAGLPMRAA